MADRAGGDRPTGGSDAGDVIIRHASASDAGPIAALHVRAWQWAFRGHLPDEYLDALRGQLGRRKRMWRRLLDDAQSEQRVWVAERGGALVGFCSTGNGSVDAAVPSGAPDTPASATRVAELHTIYVEPAVVGTGVGAALMRHALADLAARGYGEAILWVLDTNLLARRFYSKGGWREDGARKTEDVWGTPATQVRYRIALHPGPAPASRPSP